MAQEPEQCHLLGGWFANMVQALVGIIALSVLIVKRAFEVPQRTTRVWLYDTAKNTAGACTAHFCNTGIAILFSASATVQADECSLYAVALGIDVAVGVPLLCMFVRGTERLARSFNSLALIESGNYGDPPEWQVFVVQTATFVCLTMLAKLVVGLLVFWTRDSVAHLAGWTFAPFNTHPKEELVFSVVLLPCILNMLQFWLVDNFLMSREPRYISLDSERYSDRQAWFADDPAHAVRHSDGEARADQSSGGIRIKAPISVDSRAGAAREEARRLEREEHESEHEHLWSREEQRGGQTADL